MLLGKKKVIKDKATNEVPQVGAFYLLLKISDQKTILFQEAVLIKDTLPRLPLVKKLIYRSLTPRTFFLQFNVLWQSWMMFVSSLRCGLVQFQLLNEMGREGEPSPSKVFIQR